MNPYFAITDINVENYRYRQSNFEAFDKIDSGATVSWDEFYFIVNFDLFFYAINNYRGGANLMALSCAEPGYLGSQVGLDTLYIVTLADYNSSYNRNDTINNIVLANSNLYHQQNFNEFYGLGEYVATNKESIRMELLGLRLSEPPAEDLSEHRFRVIYVLANGETFTEATPPVFLEIQG